jgi:riboflavin synthase
MFTGLVTAVGTIRRVTPLGGGLDLDIAAPWPDLVPGESVAVDGACLTVARVTEGGFAVHLVTTTLERTRFSGAQAGDRCNLERALRAGDRLGGHLVQGHIDAVGEVRSVRVHGDAVLAEIAVPPEVAAVSVPLGSIAVDGVSLTVNAIPAPGVVQVSLIPFTLQHTTLGRLAAGTRVHLEADAVGRFVQALVRPHLGLKAD